MSVLRARVDREAELRRPPAVWRQFTSCRMRGPGGDGAYDPYPNRYEVVRTYNPRGFLGSKKAYAQVKPDGSLHLMTEFEARQRFGEDTALYGYVECDAAWSPLA